MDGAVATAASGALARAPWPSSRRFGAKKHTTSQNDGGGECYITAMEFFHGRCLMHLRGVGSRLLARGLLRVCVRDGVHVESEDFGSRLGGAHAELSV